MTAMEWFDALQWIHIVLIVTILLVFACYIYLLVKVTRLEFVGGLVGKRKIRVFGILFGSLVVVYLFYNLYSIQPNGWVEISLLAGLVAATGALAVYAAGQADTSVRMAEEMRKQRYDTVRPVIDIQREQSDEDKTVEVYAAIHEDTSRGLSCILQNIGLGPAIDLYSFVQNPISGESQHHPFGTLATRRKTYKMNLSLNHEENRMVLVAYYKDVYGRTFESSREVRIDKEKGWQLGPLKINPLPEKESKPQ